MTRSVALLVDSHCHIDFDGLRERIPELLDAAKAADVTHLLAISVNWEDFPRVHDLVSSYSGVSASCGIHPTSTQGHEPSFDELHDAASSDAVVAIGETGLDYFRSTGDLTWQHERFQRHIAVARALKKPLIIHTRQAAEDTLSTLKDHGAEDCGAVMHCFAEDWDCARRALDMGFYLSFSGIVTFNSAKEIQDVAKRAPQDRILVETDAPYLAPVPMRGRQNQPAYVRHTAQFVADLRGVSLASLAEATTENFYRLFPGAQAHRVSV